MLTRLLPGEKRRKDPTETGSKDQNSAAERMRQHFIPTAWPWTHETLRVHASARWPSFIQKRSQGRLLKREEKCDSVESSEMNWSRESAEIPTEEENVNKDNDNEHPEY